MKIFGRDKVKLHGGYLYEKQELNKSVTVNSVYDRFDDTGRMEAFRCDYKEGDPKKPHFFWDSDVAKWIEGAAYILADNDIPELEAKIDAIVEQIEKNQWDDGYFNIYYTVIEQGKRFTNRDRHELYCAGHLMEAAVAYAEAKGKTKLLDCMEKYADLIYKIFIEEGSAEFTTPGHEEIELALMRMYRYTGKRKYLEMAAFFINERGQRPEAFPGENKYKISDFEGSKYNQSHLPVREQTEAVGHAVRAMYLYTGMAALASETKDEALAKACKTLWEDVTERKMYVTGGLGSTNIGEAFTSAYDLPNDTSYTETCAGIGLMFFANEMRALDTNAKYADAIERVVYNGVLSGISKGGNAFFYENPLEINLSEKYVNPWGKRRFPITQRVECFNCSCCPPNLVRLFPSLGVYAYGYEKGVLYVDQYVDSTLSEGALSCRMTTDYPRNGEVVIKAVGADKVALRIPFWCDSFSINKPYVMDRGYAVVENDGDEIRIDFDMTPKAVWADVRVIRDAGKICVMRGPVVYCAEGVDNGNNLHRFSIPADFGYELGEWDEFGLPILTVDAYETLSLGGVPYSRVSPRKQRTKLKLIPYNGFANRGESDMAVWLREE